LPANDVWLLRGEFGDVPLPVIEDVIKKVDLVERKIWIEMMDGLLDIAVK